ncbi:DNA-binding protein [Devosia sp. Root685]|uniref:type II toxin-antitoxin system VapC family toxin n=1 Tax=Devosia sp. Root685 TaxID=1736587 RepID=UPI0006F2BEAD|nr:type II toxin-antitoxin system VapC family toxin [Devosia sp. Root685]KRB01489.1 DNA-binding protein [Devosia sp. Root685]
MTLVDTNVLLDLVTADPQWVDWSIASLEAASLHGPLFINDVVYAELGVRYERIELLDDFVSKAGLEMVGLPRPALFLAGKAFAQYRKAGGARSGVLPDFFIGAHAAVSRLPLLTRDAGRYRTYFPTVELISP